MKRKIKKICAVFVIIVLLPYIITIFMNGKSIEANHDGQHEKYSVYLWGSVPGFGTDHQREIE